MRGLIVLSACLVLSSFASPVLQQVEAVKGKATSELASLAYALDLSAPVSLAGFQCIRNNLYNVAFIRAYTPVGQGQIDAYAVANIQNANAAGMGTEVYMTPQPNSAKTGGQQFDEMYNNLRNSNINVQSVWIQKHFAMEKVVLLTVLILGCIAGPLVKQQSPSRGQSSQLFGGVLFSVSISRGSLLDCEDRKFFLLETNEEIRSGLE
ncbi:unnamed protein product [Haemonchus placei]|uniref:ANF_receptor domain-containing protein n=1 Tax=Haemonchus placei TaxID=6290 RepID=A0A0N4X8G8_HAEPC|nr:unnamed protein product [Haemonchus placei]